VRLPPDVDAAAERSETLSGGRYVEGASTTPPAGDQLALAVAALALLGACSREDRAEVDTALGNVADTVGAVAGRAGDAAARAADTVAGRVAGREYTNAELTGFINAYNDAEIEIGQLAQTKATDAQVRAFARRIVTDHRALKTEVTNAVRQLNIAPTMPAADEDLPEDHQAGMRDLRDKPRGREFDEAFVEHEIKMHKKVLDEVEDALERNRNQEIRAVLERARTGLQSHLTAAEELEKKFGA
jgi:putative membrane protein